MVAFCFICKYVILADLGLSHCVYIHIYLVNVKNALNVFPTFLARTFFLRFYLRFSYVFLFRFFLRFFLLCFSYVFYFGWPILKSCRAETSWRPPGRRFRSRIPLPQRFFYVFCTFFTVTMPCPPLKGICLQSGRVGGGIEKDTVFSTFLCPFFLRFLLSFFLRFFVVFATFFREEHVEKTFVQNT